jgi:hypothetical protein
MSTTKKYSIVRERVEIYKDFALNLLYYIYHYYLDKQTLSADEDIYNHYSWCYNKVCAEFKEEEIDFSKNKELKEYFFMYYYHQFYRVNDNEEITLKYFENFWKNIFEIDKQKNRNTINALIEIYTIYNKSIDKEKNILEIV